MTEVVLQLHERTAICETGVLEELVIGILLYTDNILTYLALHVSPRFAL